jgi:phage terminase large subunit GpA-like protein
VLRERVKERRSRDSGNPVLSKEFPGGVLILTVANSAVSLRSMPARYLFLDEVDGYPGDVEGEGDRILLAERRSATFQRRKILLVSTPKTKGLSRIERKYEQSDQRRFFVPCPHCHERQTLEGVEHGFMPRTFFGMARNRRGRGPAQHPHSRGSPGHHSTRASNGNHQGLEPFRATAGVRP